MKRAIKLGGGFLVITFIGYFALGSNKPAEAVILDAENPYPDISCRTRS